MNNCLQKGLSDLENMISIQKDCIVNDANGYMHGMLNGMILSHSAFAGHEPKFVLTKRKRKGETSVRHKLRRKRNKS